MSAQLENDMSKLPIILVIGCVDGVQVGKAVVCKF
jgi:hypothetical protein